ncbi:MAG: amidase family protein, partial [Pedobacter sp.]|uniref:amidase family protein n=1 Tax=Pedobacter sp. TaxID=1411316 RepID=UPI00339237E5
MKILSKKNLTVAGTCIMAFTLGSFVTVELQTAPLTADIVKQAQKIIGLQFSDAQADSMLNNLNGYRSSYEKLRKLNVPNSVVPALTFNPVPVGFVNPDQQNGFKPSKAVKVSLPANRDELAFYTVTQLAELIRTKQISAVELTKFFIARLKKYNGKLLNVITFTEEHALRKAAEADAEIKAGQYKGILHGIPFGAKDLLAKKEYKTTFGAPPYKDQQFTIDAAVITKLEAAGAILVAKTSLGELAMGDVWFGGKTKNPWETTRGSSGSSAGSASA